jgi:hypothetical protein
MSLFLQTVTADACARTAAGRDEPSPEYGVRVTGIRRETYAAIRGICNYTLVESD